MDLIRLSPGDLGLAAALEMTAGSPQSARRSISSSLTPVGTSPFSFCRPSRGPTSTILTRCGKLIPSPLVGF